MCRAKLCANRRILNLFIYQNKNLRKINFLIHIENFFFWHTLLYSNQKFLTLFWASCEFWSKNRKFYRYIFKGLKNTLKFFSFSLLSFVLIKNFKRCFLQQKILIKKLIKIINFHSKKRVKNFLFQWALAFISIKIFSAF